MQIDTLVLGTNRWEPDEGMQCISLIHRGEPLYCNIITTAWTRLWVRRAARLAGFSRVQPLLIASHLGCKVKGSQEEWDKVLAPQQPLAILSKKVFFFSIWCFACEVTKLISTIIHMLYTSDVWYCWFSFRLLTVCLNVQSHRDVSLAIAFTVSGFLSFWSILKLEDFRRKLSIRAGLLNMSTNDLAQPVYKGINSLFSLFSCWQPVIFSLFAINCGGSCWSNGRMQVRPDWPPFWNQSLCPYFFSVNDSEWIPVKPKVVSWIPKLIPIL